MAVSSFPGRPATAAFLYASLLLALDRIVSLELRPQVLSQAPQHFGSSETQFKPLIMVALPASLSALSFPLTPECPEQYRSTGGFEGGCRTLSQASLGFPFHFDFLYQQAERFACVAWLFLLQAIQRNVNVTTGNG